MRLNKNNYKTIIPVFKNGKHSFSLLRYDNSHIVLALSCVSQQEINVQKTDNNVVVKKTTCKPNFNDVSFVKLSPQCAKLKVIKSSFNLID